MINVRFYRTVNFKDGYFRCVNYKAKGEFILSFASVEDLVGWYKHQFIRMTRLKKKIGVFDVRTSVLPISPVCLMYDLTKEEYALFLSKYESVVRKYFWRLNDHVGS